MHNIRPFPNCPLLVKNNQRPRKHFESVRALSNYFMSFTSKTKILKKRNLYNVGNGLYRVFTRAKRALSFQQKRAFIQEIVSFFKWGTLARKKSTFFPLPPGSAGPRRGTLNSVALFIWLFHK